MYLNSVLLTLKGFRLLAPWADRGALTVGL